MYWCWKLLRWQADLHKTSMRWRVYGMFKLCILIILRHSIQDTELFSMNMQILFLQQSQAHYRFLRLQKHCEWSCFRLKFIISSPIPEMVLQCSDGSICRQVKGSDNGPVVSCLLETNQSQAITFKFDLREADVAAIKYKMVSSSRRVDVTTVLSYGVAAECGIMFEIPVISVTAC